MEPRREQGIADLRGVPRKARDTGNRFAGEDLRLQNKQLLASRDAIDRERQKYFELFEFSPDAYFITDSHGAIRESNVAASRLLGVPARFLAGKRLPNFFEESARKAYRQQIDQLRASERSDDWEINIQPPGGGEPTAVSISIGRIVRADRSIGGYRWILRDITKRKQAELALLASERTAREEAEKSNRVKSDFLALLSHEFRTPLQAVFGYTELLDAEIHGELNESQRRYVHRIKQSQQHLLGLINTILEFAKLESGKQIDVTLRQTPVHEILSVTDSLIGPQLDSKQLTYEYHCLDESILAYADATKVQQIVLNLLSNAIKFTRPGGLITLECLGEPRTVAIHVRDTGCGIPSDQLEAVFEPFVQIKTGGSVSKGTGLGLSISRRLAEAMGGSLSAASEPGKGSTFTLRLQRADTPS
ncbi:MAG TPA: PAS domain-containing sensor histidine kinase [Gemmatimonadaceae bacterium]|nr:PAS domain-containing sensor histidine kinase [Gemmatimonadaceae bacterium]